MNYTHSDLIDIGRKWLIKPYANMSKAFGHSSCPVIITELTTAQWEIPDVLGFCDCGSILIECKTSRADFKKDAEKPFRIVEENGVGRQRWFLAPAGLIKQEELPPKWGLLEVSEDGKIKVVKRCDTFNYSALGEMRIFLSLLRRLKIENDDHVGIKRYTSLEKSGFAPSKKKATFYVEEGE